MKKIILLFFGFFLLANENTKNIEKLIKICKTNKDCSTLEKQILHNDDECFLNKNIQSCILNASIFHLLDDKKYKAIIFDYSNEACKLDGNFSSFACNFITNDFISMYKDNNFLKDYFLNKAKKYFKIGCDKKNQSSCKSLEMINKGFYDN